MHCQDRRVCLHKVSNNVITYGQLSKPCLNPRPKVHAATNKIKPISKAQTMNRVLLRVICKRSLRFNHLLFCYSDTNKFAGMVCRCYFRDLRSKVSKSSRLALSDETNRSLNICLSCLQTSVTLGYIFCAVCISSCLIVIKARPT
jgi:hypothetical protein